MRLSLVFSSLILLSVFAGCGRTGPIQGNWTFDRDFTVAQLPPGQRPKTRAAGEKPWWETVDWGKIDWSNQEAWKPVLADALIPQLVEQLDGTGLIITDNEMIDTAKGGNGQARKYQLIEQPAADSWLIRTSGDAVQTLYREGDRLMTWSTGDFHFKIYYRRADK